MHYGRCACVIELKDKGTPIPHSRNDKRMGTSFLGNDFWDRLGGQALVMISRLPLTYHS